MESLRLLRQLALRQAQQTRIIHPNSSVRPLQSGLRLRPAPSIQTRCLHMRSRRPTKIGATVSRINNLSKTTRRFDATYAKPDEHLSLSQRLKKLSREYGWSALGVYLLLSALDFPFCFLAVRMLGVERIGHWEHVIVSKIKELIQWPLGAEATEKVTNAARNVKDNVKGALAQVEESDAPGSEKRLLEEGSATYDVTDHGYGEAEKANKGSNAGLYTQLVLAYAVHKSFIFVRVPLTAAVTPKVVKTLRGWGWNIGKRPAKTVPSASTPGVNTKGSKVGPNDS